MVRRRPDTVVAYNTIILTVVIPYNRGVYALSLDLSPLAAHPLPNPFHVALEGAEGIGGAMAFEVVPTIAGRLHSDQYTKIIILVPVIHIKHS